MSTTLFPHTQTPLTTRTVTQHAHTKRTMAITVLLMDDTSETMKINQPASTAIQIHPKHHDTVGRSTRLAVT